MWGEKGGSGEGVGKEWGSGLEGGARGFRCVLFYRGSKRRRVWTGFQSNCRHQAVAEMASPSSILQTSCSMQLQEAGVGREWGRNGGRGWKEVRVDCSTVVAREEGSGQVFSPTAGTKR